MKIRELILSIFSLLLPLSTVAQDETPSVSPTAEYTDDEGTKTESVDAISGQAPLEVTFKANPSGMDSYTPIYEWHFSKEGEETDWMVRYEEETTYTFNDSGTTFVTLKVVFTNGDELDPVTFTVTVSESKLVFPNAFSPNGDEYNPVFKAKEYQSLVEFHAYIFNRWGQKLFDWTDPSQGWDGTYNGNDVKEGVYFLLCKAKGADGREYTIRKDVNLLRGFTEGTTVNE